MQNLFPLMMTATMMGSPSTTAPTTYLTVFAAQSNPYKPQKTHTFATMLRLKPGQPVEMATISWLPATMKVRGLAIRPECGVNWGLAETLDWSARGGMCVSVWGPYPVDDCLFDAFNCQVAKLQSGRIYYKSLDALRPNRNAINCVHAVQGVRVDKLKPVGPFGYGETATRESLDHFAPGILDWTPQPELLKVMGVDPACVKQQSLCHRPTRRENLDSFIR